MNTFAKRALAISLVALPSLFACGPNAPTVLMDIADLNIATSGAADTLVSEAPVNEGSSYTLDPALDSVSFTSEDFNISNKTTWSMHFSYEVDGTSHGLLNATILSFIDETDKSIASITLEGMSGLAIGAAITQNGSLNLGFDFSSFNNSAPGTYWVWIDYAPAEGEGQATLKAYHSDSAIKPAVESATLNISMDYTVALEALPDVVDGTSIDGKTYFVLEYVNTDDVTAFTLNSDFSFTATPATLSIPTN